MSSNRPLLSAPMAATAQAQRPPRRDWTPARLRPFHAPALTRSLSVAVVDESPLIVNGLRSMLEPHVPGLRVVAGRSGTAGEPVDITLYDPAPPASSPSGSTTLSALLAGHAHPRIVAFSFSPSEELVAGWLAAGCAGVVDKRAPAEQLAGQIVSLVAEQRDTHRTAAPVPGLSRPHDTWPGQEHGLSRRESQMIVLITQGLTNADISTHAGLSVNTVKTYIRSAYAKIGATRRPEAVRWGAEHGMLGATRSG